MRNLATLATVLVTSVACGNGPTLSPDAAASHQEMLSACAPAWSQSAVYTSGNQASVNGVNYTAAYWTQGQNPANNNGPAGSGQPWISNGSCDGGSPSPSPNPQPQPQPQPTPQPTPTTGIFFSPYKDVTINTNWNTDVMSTAVTGSQQSVLSAVPNLGALTWAFATGECGSETWGGISGAALASANVSAWSNAGKKYVISTGGAAGSFTCGSDSGFSAFIDRYDSPQLAGVDFDIEAGQSQDDINNLVARVKTALSNPKYANLRFSFTVATFGGNQAQSLGQKGQMVMNAIQSGGLSNYYVNLMAMDYGAASPSSCTVGSNGLCNMGASAVAAANDLHSYYNVPYGQIELTPMIGGNDTQDETFTLNDVTTVTNFAKQNGLGGVHFWSLDRDTDCAPGYASPTCNSYGQAGTLGFTNAFSGGL